MPVDLKDRSDEDSGIHPDWYRPGDDSDDSLEDQFNAPSATDDDLPTGHPSRSDSKKAATSSDLAAAESGAETPGASSEEEAEKSAVSSETAEGGGWKTDVKSKKKGFWTNKRKGAGAAIAGIGVTSALGISSFLGPTLAINHLRELLLTKVSELQTGHSLRYRRRYIHKVGDMFTRDGRRGGKIIAEMETRGYKFEFDKDGKMRGITPPGATSSISGAGVADHLHDYMEVRHPLRTSKWKTKRMEAFYNRYKVSRTPVTTRAPTDPEDPERAVNKKIAGDVHGENIDSTVTPKAAGTEETPEQEAARKKAAEGGSAKSGLYEDIKTKLRDGTPISELTPEEQSALRISDNVDRELADLLENAATSGSVGGKVFRSIGSFLNIADVGDKICIVRNRLGAIQFAARTYKALGLLRYASTFIKVGDATRSSGTVGRADPGMINAVMKRATATDRNGNTLGGSPGMAYIIKGKFSKSKNDAGKGNYGVDGKLTGFPGVVDNAVPGISKTQCGVIQNPGFQIGGTAISVVVGVLSGGTSAAAGQTAKEAFTQVLKAGMKSMLTKRVARSLASGIVIDLSFEAAMVLMQFYAEKSMTLPFTGQEQGGELGDILGGGAGTLNARRGSAAGQVPATSQQYAQAYQTYLAEKEADRQNQSFFARFLDMDNTDSFAFQTTSELALSPAGTIGTAASTNASGLAYVARSVLSAPAASVASVSGLITGRATAQSDPDEISFDTHEVGGNSLATDPAGNPLTIMRADIEAIDPEENIKYLGGSSDIDPSTLEPSSKDFKEHIVNCVDAVDIYTPLEEDEKNPDPKTDCLAKQQITKRYKAHIAYLDMTDGLDAALFPEEILPVSDAEGSSNPNLYMIGDSLSVGMRDTGKIADLYRQKGWTDVCVEAQQSRPLGGTNQLSAAGPTQDCRGASPVTKYYGLGQLDQSPDKEAIAAAGTVVIALGTNDAPTADSTFRENVTKMVDKVRAMNPTASIKWVNFYSSSSNSGYSPANFAKLNSALKELSGPKNFSIIDWNSVAAEHYKSGDGIHPTNYQAMAEYVVNGVGSPAPAGGGAAIPGEGLAWPMIQTKAEAKANLGGCLKAQAICTAGHPYKAHDLFAKQGTQVVAVAKGDVIKASTGGCGHGFGAAFTVQVYNKDTNITYFYQHMDAGASGVSLGATVNPGDPIGKVGPTSAACNTPPHLHIDAVTGRGRPACSRLSCAPDAKARFLDIGGGLFKGYEVLK